MTILNNDSCNALYCYCDVTVLFNDGPPFGFVAGLTLKDPSSAQAKQVVHQYDPGNNPNVVVYTIDDNAGLYIMNCPRPPCAEGKLS